MENKTLQNLISKLNSADAPFVITIKVIAGAKQNSIEDFSDDIIKVRINKPAVDGKANKAIIEYISETLGLPKSNVIITKGEKNSIKNLQITPK